LWLTVGQQPEALFITCSDSRINPTLLTQTDPGELSILRNAGNIVQPLSQTIPHPAQIESFNSEPRPSGSGV
jgi:carbonic anhydrase